jgi:gliding motility-associated-like protein
MLLLSAVSAFAQTMTMPDVPEPTAYVIDAKGEEAELSPGGDFSGEAPVTVKLSANAAEFEGYSLVVEWTFTREGEAEPYLTRHDADVEIEISTSGTTIIQPKITYTQTNNKEIFWEYGADTYEPFRVVLAESALDVPNAFSPNGDGINDYFNVYNAKSIVSFSAAIFNRWGQKLYSWGIDEMNCEGCGWDGTFNGKPVKAGVYYVVVKAKGADGIEYEYRKDVNLLRGYSEEVGR